MNNLGIPRRDFVIHSTAVLAGLALASTSFFAKAFPVRPSEEVIPWLDQPAPNAAPAVVRNLPRWEDLHSFITPNDKFFQVGHYNWPTIDEAAWRLDVSGLVQRPLSLTLSDLKARPRREVVSTLECAGNHGLQFLVAAIGTAKWAGTPLASILEEAGIKESGIEVVFIGAYAGEEQVRTVKTRQNFARSMAVADAMSADNLLCYEMNEAPLPQGNGFPLRLLAPGWFGVANVKWLERIEVRDTRFMGRFMARDYVTIREERRGERIVGMETLVGRMLLKSAPGRVTRQNGQYRIVGAAWGGDVAKVEVQIDGEPWQAASIDRSEASKFTWDPWFLDWPTPSPGEHAITSRVTDAAGQVQPTMNDPPIANKRTYWESNGQVTRRVVVG